ncbi:MAG: M3 family metallopeptidase [Oligoflexia bacterium]|nr:M3 family metallopeptidase [Oligoflexia bacterium]
MTESQENPLLKSSSGSGLAHGAVPFHEIREEHFLPAVEAVLAEARSRLRAIREDARAPSFENSIEGIEFCAERLDTVANTFSNLLHAHSSDKLQALAKEIMPRLAAFSNDISLDPGLFQRVRAVYDQRATLGLDAEQAMLLEKTHRFFARNGAKLAEKGKERLREIDQKLALLGQQFGDNVLKATNQFELVLRERAELAGLPDSVLEGAASEAKDRGKEGQWVFTLQQPSFVAFMKYSERRELRERLWKAYMTRATSGDTDNRGIAKELASLRHERARLLGYATHAHFTLEERMASAPVQVTKFLDRLHAPSRKAAEAEVEELRAFAGLPELHPWDVSFYSDKLKKARFGLDEETLRPYFKLENVVNGAFEHARKLYGLSFRKRTDLPAYHPDVEIHEVTDDKGSYVGLFYADFFPRESKRSGAWMTTFREQGYFEGAVGRPLVSIVCNLTKPTPSRPSLLTLDEVRTVFHEFGHSLHALLSRCRYRSLAGTNVYWDFVELPSQIMENWVKEQEGLDLFARHYESGEKIPHDLVRRIQAASRFQAGWFSLRQLSFGKLDMAWHASDPSDIGDIEEFERQAIESCMLFPHVPGSVISCGFSHIFAGGYSAGYYSYKWAEVLEADAFEFFREKGLFSHEVAERFKENILSRGGTEHPMELYKRFRGREPDPDALLRRDGLLA